MINTEKEKKVYLAEICNDLTDDEINHFSYFHKNKKKKILFLKHLVTIKGLHKKTKKDLDLVTSTDDFGRSEGQQLCTYKIGEALGISHASVNNYLKELVSLGVLIITNNKFKAGARSKAYLCVDATLYGLFFKYHTQSTDNKKFQKRLRFLYKRKKRIEVFNQINATKHDIESNNTDKIPKELIHKLCLLYIGQADLLKNDLKKFIEPLAIVRKNEKGNDWNLDALYVIMKVNRYFQKLNKKKITITTKDITDILKTILGDDLEYSEALDKALDNYDMLEKYRDDIYDSEKQFDNYEFREFNIAALKTLAKKKLKPSYVSRIAKNGRKLQVFKHNSDMDYYSLLNSGFKRKRRKA